MSPCSLYKPCFWSIIVTMDVNSIRCRLDELLLEAQNIMTASENKLSYSENKQRLFFWDEDVVNFIGKYFPDYELEISNKYCHLRRNFHYHENNLFYSEGTFVDLLWRTLHRINIDWSNGRTSPKIGFDVSQGLLIGILLGLLLAILGWFIWSWVNAVAAASSATVIGFVIYNLLLPWGRGVPQSWINKKVVKIWNGCKRFFLLKKECVAYILYDYKSRI